VYLKNAYPESADYIALVKYRTTFQVNVHLVGVLPSQLLEKFLPGMLFNLVVLPVLVYPQIAQ